MRKLTTWIGIGILVASSHAPVGAQVPVGVTVDCDVNRTQFRSAATDVSQLCFRLWNAEVGGQQIGGDHCVAAGSLIVTKLRTDRFGTQPARSFARLSTAIGTLQDPVLPVASDVWLEVVVGPQVLSCGFSTGSVRRHIDSALFAQVSGVAGAVPAGTIAAYAGPAAPNGWLICDGSAVSRSAYGSLYAAIGTTYGVGDGQTTFGLPDLRGRVVVGRGSNPAVSALGQGDGAVEALRRPQHIHVVDPHIHHIGPHTHEFLMSTGITSGHLQLISPAAIGRPGPIEGRVKQWINRWDEFNQYEAASTVIGEYYESTEPGGAGDTDARAPGTNAAGPAYTVVHFIVKL
jgi:microcystin-dependent protein